MADVFLSYSRSDKARVAPLVAAIEAQGWSVWWDPVITPGQEFDVEIAAQLKSAAAVLVVWTPQSVTSRWVRGEARDGADRGILVPVRFAGAELPIDVRALHTVDLDEWTDDRNPQIQEMLRTLRTVIARARGSPPVLVNSAAAQAPAHGDAARIEICVLPFANMSGDPAQEYFSDGITEDIITELSRWRLLAVRSRSASFRYRGVSAEIKQVARELNVHFVVEGSIRRMGERIRISVQLIDGQTGSQVWSEKFDRQLDEIFAVQDRVVQTIVSTLVGRVQASDVERARRKPPASLAAYECVLRANALPWDDPDGMAQAVRLVEKSIELDPAYGFAHALLASLRQSQWYEDRNDSDAVLEEAYALAMQAVALDDSESTCHAILGHVCVRRGSHELAVQYAQRAVEINPNNQWNAADLGAILIYVGQSEEALTWFARAREIDPYFDPPWYWRSIALAYMNLHRYGEALSKLRHARVRNHRYTALIAACQAKLGDMEAAKASAADVLRMKHDFSIAQFMRKEPFKIPADAEQLASSLRQAGLPG
jgi:TolB-like protein/tetratricopeptide (TPR) repeat protein